MQIKEINQLKKEIEILLSDNKALEIKSIDLKNKTSIADFMIIASGTPSRHIQAYQKYYQMNLKKKELIIVNQKEKIAANGNSLMQKI